MGTFWDRNTLFCRASNEKQKIFGLREYFGGNDVGSLFGELLGQFCWLLGILTIKAIFRILLELWKLMIDRISVENKKSGSNKNKKMMKNKNNEWNEKTDELIMGSFVVALAFDKE